MEKYTGYATRSENTRNPERMSHGNVARKRYKRIDQRGKLVTLGQGRITGHQKRNPATKNDACSRPCHASDCRPSVNSTDTCHPIRVSVETAQHKAGWESTRANCRINGRCSSGPSTACPYRGNPCQRANIGSP